MSSDIMIQLGYLQSSCSGAVPWVTKIITKPLSALKFTYCVCARRVCVWVVMGSRSMCVVVYVWRATDNPVEAIQLSLPCGSWDQVQVTKLTQQSLNSPGTSPDLVVLL